MSVQASGFRSLLVLLLGCLVQACVPQNNQATTSGPAALSTVTSPNIIFIMADDMGWGDVGFRGADIHTPNIDRLVERGVRLDRAYSYPVCSPTRAALMTGMNPLGFGIDGPMQDGEQLPRELEILPQFFKRAGYQTWMVGKWHLGIHDVQAMPHSRGFDSYYGHLGGYVDFYTHTYFGGIDWQRNGRTVREQGYTTDLLTAEAVSLVEDYDGSEPFFLYLAYNAPHTPLQFPPTTARHGYEEFQDPNRHVFAEMMSSLDTGIGQLIDAINEAGIRNNTLIIFVSDNGGNLRAGASNGELRAGKGSVYEGGVRVPGVVSWPTVLPENGELDYPIFPQDWAPTLLSAVDVTFDAERFEGTDTWPEIVGAGEVFRHTPVILGSRGSYAVYDWPYKLIRLKAEGNSEAEIQLFDVVTDPREMTNLATERPLITQKLVQALDTFPMRASKAAKGPRPEDLFKDEDGNFVYDLRLPETRAPWAESAIDSAVDAGAN
ncbi:MAG: arylsulfatase B [Henriciella sp.]